MADYRYVAKDEKSRTVKGREFAMSERDLVMRMARKNLTVISVTRAESGNILSRLFSPKRRLKTFDQMVFCKQLATLIKGGIPLIKGLEVMAGEAENQVLQIALAEVVHYIKQGNSFSMSLKKMSVSFSPLFVAMVDAGEKIGALDVMLERLAKYLAAQERISRKIIAAITYPVVILIVFFAAIGIMTMVLVPKFRGMYTSIGAASLPRFTEIIFGVSNFMIHYSVFFILGIAGFIIYLNSTVLKTKQGRYAFDMILLKLPIFGKAFKKAALSKFARTLAALLEQGIPVPEALELVGRTSGNAVIEAASQKASKLIIDGNKIPEAFRKVDVFPSLVNQMANIGTESGNLPALLDKTADFYEDEVDVFISVMSSLIEPVLIVVLGVVLGVFIVGLYLPIFSMGQSAGMK